MRMMETRSAKALADEGTDAEAAWVSRSEHYCRAGTGLDPAEHFLDVVS